jgi:hypothetical protein
LQNCTAHQRGLDQPPFCDSALPRSLRLALPHRLGDRFSYTFKNSASDVNRAILNDGTYERHPIAQRTNGRIDRKFSEVRQAPHFHSPEHRGHEIDQLKLGE